MAITYHAGRRIQGTATDRTGADAVSGGWKELGRTTLGSASTDISVSSLADKRYYMILHSHLDNGTSMRIGNRVNNDSGTNYAERRSANGGSDNTNTSATEINITDAVNTAENWLGVNYIANKSDKEKLQISHYVGESTAGAGNAPKRTEVVSKFANTSDAINRWDSVRIGGTGQADSGSEVVVLGYDPSDSHTDNFWEELASVQGDGTSTTLSSGTIQSKKYLWLQGFTGDAGGAHNSGLQFNSDTGSNYATRRNLDGGSDTLWTSESYTQLGTSTNCFFNTFIINNSANEKLAITYWVQRLSTGAGNAPSRGEFVGKWANTSSQITNVSLVQQTTSINWGTDVHLKVWGSN